MPLVHSFLLHLVAFFHVASLLSTETVGVDNEKALELDNNFFIFQPDFNVEISPKRGTKHPVANILV